MYTQYIVLICTVIHTVHCVDTYTLYIMLIHMYVRTVYCVEYECSINVQTNINRESCTGFISGGGQGGFCPPIEGLCLPSGIG